MLSVKIRKFQNRQSQIWNGNLSVSRPASPSHKNIQPCNRLIIKAGFLPFRSINRPKWRWRESNPRPNKEPPGFLHAYSAVGFRAAQGSERPKRDLIS